MSAKNASDDFRRQRSPCFLWKLAPDVLFHHSVCFLNFAKVTIIDDKNQLKLVSTCATLSAGQLSLRKDAMVSNQYAPYHQEKKKSIFPIDGNN